ncbi:MAG: PilZ domain-containing protein [Candidatus Acidiferrales bacterium]
MPKLNSNSASVSFTSLQTHANRSEGINSRSVVRYSLSARAVFTWRDSSGNLQESRGVTRNVSPKGAYIFAPRCPANGSPLSISIFLPPMGSESRTLCIETEGRVVRTDTVTEGSVGFAVSSHRVNLCVG